MKRMLFTFATALLLVMTLQALAQSDQQPGQEQGAHRQRMGKRGNPDQELAHLTKQLNLTSDQQSKIKPILENQAEQMKQLHQDTSLAQQDRATKMHGIRENTTTQIRDVLNPDQQQKFDTMEKKREAHHHGKGGQTPPQ